MTGHPAEPLPGCRWLEEGRLLLGPHPEDESRDEYARRLDALLGAGITYFIDLSAAEECPSYAHLLPTVRAADGRYVVYVRMAVPRGAAPASERAMADILDYVDRALEVGHVVYLHARGAGGRTATVAACWLCRHGLAAEAALARVAPAAHEDTPSLSALQRDWVRSWREPPAEAGFEIDLSGAQRLYRRYLGAVYGLAIGDALGASVQFLGVTRFAPVRDLGGGGRWRLPPGAFTDDAALFLATAESLAAREAVDVDDLRGRFGRWRREGAFSSTGECVGITAAVARAAGEAPGSAAELGAGSPFEPLPRAGAAALAAPDHPARALDWAARIAALTHPGPSSRSLARRHAALLLAALRGATADSLLAEARALLRAHGGGADDGQELDWLPAALAGATGFRDGVLAVVNGGGDADVRGALFGQLAGALWGVAAIPEVWRAAIRRREMLTAAADRLLAAALTDAALDEGEAQSTPVSKTRDLH